MCRELELSECRGVSGAALQAVLTGALPALETVLLTGIPEVSNSLLAEMGLGLPLRHINVANCIAVGNEGLRGLAVACPQLLTLNADKCTKVTDEGVVAIAESCKELQVRLLECQASEHVSESKKLLLRAAESAMAHCVCITAYLVHSMSSAELVGFTFSNGLDKWSESLCVPRLPHRRAVGTQIYLFPYKKRISWLKCLVSSESCPLHRGEHG